MLYNGVGVYPLFVCLLLTCNVMSILAEYTSYKTSVFTLFGNYISDFKTEPEDQCKILIANGC